MDHCAGIIRRRIVNDDDFAGGQRLRCDRTDRVSYPGRSIAGRDNHRDRGHYPTLFKLLAHRYIGASTISIRPTRDDFYQKADFSMHGTISGPHAASKSALTTVR